MPVESKQNNHQNLKFISLSVESYDKKTAENDRNSYDAEKRTVSKPYKISITNFDSIDCKLELLLCQHFTSLSEMLMFVLNIR